MPTYGILAHPGHNRVYFDQSAPLCLAELAIAGEALGLGDVQAARQEVCGVPYYVFSPPRPLEAEQWRGIARLSFVYALFELEEAEGGALRLQPVERPLAQFVDESIGTILKYSGKTNELFTRLMINVALFSSRFAREERTVLLDPVAGKGTTLFEGLVAGHDVRGVEIGERAVHECCVYLKKYLANARFKHSYQKEKLSGEAKSFRAVVHRFELAKSKADRKEAGSLRSAAIVAGDSRYTHRYWKKNSVHLIVGDLPYGVAHGNVSGGKGAAGGHGSPTRSPKELVAACLPGWKAVLKPGGAVVLAWNTFVFPKEQMEQLLEDAGFAVLRGGPYDSFAHRVDQSIRRDLVVALKT